MSSVDGVTAARIRSRDAMTRLLTVLLLATFASTAFAAPAGERRVMRKVNGGAAKGTLVGGRLHAPKTLRVVLEARPRTTYKAFGETSCQMADGKYKQTQVQRTVRKGRYELRIPLPKGTLKPTGYCTVMAGGLAGNKPLGRTRLTASLFGTFGPPGVRPSTLSGKLDPAYVGGYLRFDEDVEVEGNQPVKTVYGWERCDGAGENCTDLPDQRTYEYRVQQGDLGMRLRGKLTATDRDGTTVARTALSPPVVQEDPQG